MMNKTIDQLTFFDLKQLIRFFEYDRIGTNCSMEYSLPALFSLKKDCGDWDGLDAFFEEDREGFRKAIDKAEQIMLALEPERGDD